MSVKLISATEDAEEKILYIARVSSNQENTSTGLIKFLIRNGHWSPFEMAHMVLEIETSRAISAQICRHRSFSFQEFSQRYSEVEGTVKYGARRQADKNRQSSVDDMAPVILKEFDDLQHYVERFCFESYHRALDLGIAKECARFLLPLASKTKIYMSGTLRSWIHYLGDGPGGRNNEHTQLEHKQIAEEARNIFMNEFPIISYALGWEHE